MPAVRPRGRRLAGPVSTVATALCACLLVCGGGYAGPAWAVQRPAPAKSLAGRPRASRVVVLHLRRPGLDRISEVWVYRPPGSDSAKLPVVYFLHGHPGGPADIFRAGLRRVMDRYVARGGVPFVIAAPDGNSSRHLDTEWGDASDGTDAVESYLVQAVIPTVEGTHPRVAGRRAIAGFSMGGYGAVNIALHHPDLFDQVVSLAGYFRPDDTSQMFATVEARLANSPEANAAQARGKRVLLSEPRAERESLVRGQSRVFARVLDGQGAAVIARTAPGAHDLAFVIAEIPTVTRFLALGFRMLPGA